MARFRSLRPLPPLPALAILVVTGAVVAALLLLGTPSQQRSRWADSLRVQDLQSIKHAIDRFYAQRRQLPESLAQLEHSDGGGAPLPRIRDVQTKQLYEYRALGQRQYELGAVFETDTSFESITGSDRTDHYAYRDKSLPFWKHESGPQRFRLRAKDRQNRALD